MKSRLVLLSMMLVAIATVASAQTKSRYYAESSKDNYFVSLSAGAQKCIDPNASENEMTLSVIRGLCTGNCSKVVISLSWFKARV